MTERFLKRPRVRQRLERSPLASIVGAFVGHLDAQGYGKATAQMYLQAAAHFGRWLHRKHQTVAQADETAVQTFVASHLPHCRCPTPRPRTRHVVRAALHQLLVVLRAEGVLAAVSLPPSPADLVVARFELHLTHTCGAAAATRHYYRREARDLLVARFGSGPVDLAAITPADVGAFVMTRAAVLAPASINAVRTAVRSFLRFLSLHGCGPPGAVFTVPRAANWRLAGLPAVLTDGELAAFLAAFDRATSTGRRDYAMALCLSGLGLRASEVARPRSTGPPPVPRSTRTN